MVRDPLPGRIEALCRKWNVRRMWLFGSALRDEHTARDIDLLYQFDPEASPSLTRFASMQDDFENELGRPVDLVSRAAVERSANWIRREAILSTARLIYES